MANFDQHIGPLLDREGGFKLVNHPNDRGRRTYAGISERWHPNWEGWKMLSAGVSPAAIEEAVRRFYRENYWNAIRGDELNSEDVAEAMLSCAVLSGVKRCIVLAQQVARTGVDGKMGPQTLGAINRMEPKLFEATFALSRIMRFREICNRDKSQRVFLLGWLNRVAHEMAT